MIRYALHCDRLHEFDGWFASSADFDQQSRRGFVTCPVCDSRSVEKQIMAPALTKDRTRPVAAENASTAIEPGPTPAPDGDFALIDAKDRELRAMIRALRARITSEAEDVGPRFAEEARRIHFGESEGRAIYGRATLEEARDLAEDGVAFAPIPSLPDESN